MRFLNTKTIQLEEFFDHDIPHYAILSHRWGKAEASFEDVQYGKAKEKEGYPKIEKFCAKAAEMGLEYGWVDTCCIDKRSSSELSEAINSMFKWYQRAFICFAYLSDVPTVSLGHFTSKPSLKHSEWFTRGWTLQELLAPSIIYFFDQEWVDLGTKTSLAPIIASITGIEPSFLENFKEASISQKMSWAAWRKTTRIEDIAYCLLGLFNVHMPLLYGEGENAFVRLQLEILKESDDETIFAWESMDSEQSAGLLATSPDAFKWSGDIVPYAWDPHRPAYSMTNKGLRFEPLFHRDESGDLQVPLNCKRLGTDLPLETWLREHSGKYIRTRMNKLWPFEESDTLKEDVRLSGIKGRIGAAQNKCSSPKFERKTLYILAARLEANSPRSKPASLAFISVILPTIMTPYSETINVDGNSTARVTLSNEGHLISFSRLRMLCDINLGTSGGYAFTVLVEIVRPRCHLELVVLSNTGSYNDILLSQLKVQRFDPFTPPAARPDRVSKLLPGGQIVSVGIWTGFLKGMMHYQLRLSVNKMDGRASLDPRPYHADVWLTADRDALRSWRNEPFPKNISYSGEDYL